jgi:WS/DGAT/MGAT family acyltransferase
MRETDAFSWYMEKDPALRSTILAVAWLERSPDFEVLASRLERATRLIPRFRQRPVDPPGRLATPRWTDTHFDLSLHLRRVNAPTPATDATVVELARLEAMSGFDRARPLWQFTLVEQLIGGRAALIMKVHHSLTDGIGGMQLALLLFETTAALDPGEQVTVPRAEPDPSTVRVVRESLLYDGRRALGVLRRGVTGAVPAAARTVRDPVGALADVLATARSVGRFVQPVSGTLSNLMTGRGLDRHLDMLAVDLEDMRQAAHSVGGTLNDVFVASVTGGLRRYHELHHAKVEDLRITLPISIRKDDDPTGGNRITLERFTLPVGVADPAARVRLTGERCRSARDERAIPFSNSIAGTLNLLPSRVVGSMLKNVDFVASNVPGVNMPIFLGGAPVSSYYAFGPTTGSSLNVTLLSYNGTCCIGFTIDTAAAPDYDALMACCVEGFEEVLSLGGDHLPVARPL